MDFAAPLNGLVYISISGNFAVRGVGVGGGELSFCGVEFADVLGEVPVDSDSPHRVLTPPGRVLRTRPITLTAVGRFDVGGW